MRTWRKQAKKGSRRRNLRMVGEGGRAGPAFAVVLVGSRRGVLDDGQ